MPVSVKDIPKIKKDFNLDINVYGFKVVIYTLSVKYEESPVEQNKKMVNLLLTLIIILIIMF